MTMRAPLPTQALRLPERDEIKSMSKAVAIHYRRGAEGRPSGQGCFILWLP